jgi:hypothetical protein
LKFSGKFKPTFLTDDGFNSARASSAFDLNRWNTISPNLSNSALIRMKVDG